MDFEGLSFKDTGKNLSIKSDGNIFSEQYYYSDFFDEKGTRKFIKNIESLVRSSREYKNYIEQLRTNFSHLNQDAVMGNISTLDTDLEFHHYPFTLYDICEIVVMKGAADQKYESSFSAAKKIMDLHYKNVIGLVPLTKTNHELAHDGKIFLSTKQIFGNWEEFYNQYLKYISVENKNKIKDLKEKSEANLPTDFMGFFK